MKVLKSLFAVVAVLAVVAGTLPAALASSHREAPAISQDPTADATDFFAFVSPDNPNTVTLIANYIPMEEPAGGPNFYRFSDDVLYEIKVDSDGDAKPDISYQFRFKTTIANPETFLQNVGPITGLNHSNQNVRQTYTLTKVEGGQSTVLGSDLPIPSDNVGPKSLPNYEALSNSAVQSLPGGIKSFVGQVDDPFFVELGGIFDLLSIRKLPGDQGGGVDGLAGYNVKSLALQVPIEQLTSSKTRISDAKDPKAVIGTWTTASRQATKVIADNGTASASGPWVQVSRLGAPLVNEVVIPLGKKDIFNGSKPENDAQFANYVTNPELGGLMKALFGIAVPPQGAFGSPQQRDDLLNIFVLGIPGLTRQSVGAPGEELRLNTAIAPSANPNRLGVLGGDTAGYPNGRRLADDVTDISLRAVAGAAYPLFHPDFKPDPVGVRLGDGVDANDKPFRSTFPYLALPHNGYDSNPHVSKEFLQSISTLIGTFASLLSGLH